MIITTFTEIMITVWIKSNKTFKATKLLDARLQCLRAINNYYLMRLWSNEKDTVAMCNNKSKHENQQHFIKEAMLCQQLDVV